MDLPVGHYLRIYKIRRSGISAANRKGREFIDTLVERLAKLDPELPCQLLREPSSNGGEWFAFVVNGEQIARIHLQHPSEDVSAP